MKRGDVKECCWNEIGKRENLEKAPKILTLSTTIVPLSDSYTQTRTPVGADERSNTPRGGKANME